VEEGKGQGGLATSRQYDNALLGLRYQEEINAAIIVPSISPTY